MTTTITVDMQSSSNNKEMFSNRDNYKIDKDLNRYPNCIIWTPIPLLT